MAIQWGRFTQPDGRDHSQIQISVQSDRLLFDQVARTLEVGLSGIWTDKLEGPDERYWDLVVRRGRLTLHLQHYLGITLYPTAGADADTESLDLLQRAYDLLASQVAGC